MGHVNNAAYLDYLEEALPRRRARPAGDGAAIPRRVRLEYLAPAAPGARPAGRGLAARRLDGDGLGVAPGRRRRARARARPVILASEAPEPPGRRPPVLSGHDPGPPCGARGNRPRAGRERAGTIAPWRPCAASVAFGVHGAATGGSHRIAPSELPLGNRHRRASSSTLARRPRSAPWPARPASPSLVVRRQNRRLARLAEHLARGRRTRRRWSPSMPAASATRGCGRPSQALADRVADTWRLATVDPLTGIANRQAVLDRVDEELARAARYRRPLSVILVDLDHFKRLNDSHGHAAGDMVLRHVGAAARGQRPGGGHSPAGTAARSS